MQYNHIHYPGDSSYSHDVYCIYGDGPALILDTHFYISEAHVMNSTCVSSTTDSVIVLGSTAAASVIVCSASLFQIVHFRLYRKLVYRLAAYQVFSGLMFGGISVFQFLFLNYSRNPALYESLCIAVSFIHQYTIDVKLIFAIWVTFHLFFFVVLDRNMKKLEPLYVGTSLVIPLALACVPFTTGTYGLSGSWCWIQNRVHNCPSERSVPGIIEQFALLYAPAAIALILQSAAMVAIIVVLFRRKRKAQLIGGKVHAKAFKQVLPLTTYPIAFCVLIIPPLTNRVYGSVTLHSVPNALVIVASFCYPLWSFMSGLALLVHVCYVRSTLPKPPKITSYDLLLPNKPLGSASSDCYVKC